MIILFEGPDGSGKSTLNAAITEMLQKNGHQVINSAREIWCEDKPTSPRRVTEPMMFKYLKTMVKDKQFYMYERGPISDNIYRVFDNYSPVTTINKFINFLAENEKQVFVIYCRTDLAEKKMLERGDENPVAIEKHKELTKIYDIVMRFVKEKFKYNFIRFDYSKRGSMKEVLDKIEQFAFMNVR